MSEFDLAFSDGAAAIVLVSGQKALELGLTVIAKISGYADAAHVCKIYFFMNFKLSLQFWSVCDA